MASAAAYSLLLHGRRHGSKDSKISGPKAVGRPLAWRRGSYAEHLASPCVLQRESAFQGPGQVKLKWSTRIKIWPSAAVGNLAVRPNEEGDNGFQGWGSVCIHPYGIQAYTGLLEAVQIEGRAWTKRHLMFKYELQ